MHRDNIPGTLLECERHDDFWADSKGNQLARQAVGVVEQFPKGELGIPSVHGDGVWTKACLFLNHPVHALLKGRDFGVKGI